MCIALNKAIKLAGANKKEVLEMEKKASPMSMIMTLLARKEEI